ncbi:MAG: hypothetical protein DBY20_05315 [Coriobacteriia bacterium]|nr:MAG: hypothetical protein DBY20_05315 [Coriobacteriia bacterium]
MLTIEDIAEALREAVAPYDVRAGYLFGSFARGEEERQSDVDVRLECGHDVNYSDLLSMQELLEERLGRSVEIVTNPPEFMRPAFRKRIQQDEVLLYETA